MESYKLHVTSKAFEELSKEAKTTFIDKFPYLKITETTPDYIYADQLLHNVPETDGSILVGITAHLKLPFSVVETLIKDRNVHNFNYTIIHKDSKNVSIMLDRFYYHTKNKLIFSM